MDNFRKACCSFSRVLPLAAWTPSFAAPSSANRSAEGPGAVPVRRQKLECQRGAARKCAYNQIHVVLVYDSSYSWIKFVCIFSWCVYRFAHMKIYCLYKIILNLSNAFATCILFNCVHKIASYGVSWYGNTIEIVPLRLYINWIYFGSRASWLTRTVSGSSDTV